MNVHSFSGIMKKVNNKKEIILDAAVKVFAQKGFYNAKVADVAREAGIADGTIYLYFKNKDDLLISLFETKMEEILFQFNERLKNITSPCEKLRQFILLHFEMIENNPDLAEVFQVELRQSNKFLKDYHNQKFIDFLNIIGDILKEGKSRGEFKSDLKINSMKVAIFGAVDELARQWILIEEPIYELKTTALEIADLFIRGLSPTMSGGNI